MLDRGELDAAFGLVPRADHEPSPFEKVDRYGGTPIEGNPKLRKFFTDGGRQIVTDYHRKTGILPSNHIIVVQQRIVDEHPWVARELFSAFQRAKEAAYQRARAMMGAYLLFEAEDYKQQAALFGSDPYPLGIEKNRAMLDVLFRASHEEGLTNRLARVEDIFDKSLLDT
jgi:4,5-dihydroxyphthalate decarboxylase